MLRPSLLPCRSVGAGFGWSLEQQRCGGYANTVCPVDEGGNEQPGQLPRVTIAEFEQRADLLGGTQPFVLKDATDGWRAINDWHSKEFFVSLFPCQGTNLKFCGNDLFSRPEHFLDGRGEQDSVWYVPLLFWRQIEMDILPLHDWLFNQEGAAEDIIQEPLLASLFSTTEWRTIVFGEKGTTSFWRRDSFELGTWQAQITGTRRWRVCAPGKGNRLDAEGADYNLKFMGGARVSQMETLGASVGSPCFDEIIDTGEVLYYPPRWWHRTTNLGAKSIAVSGRVLAPDTYVGAITSLKIHCDETPPYGDCYDAQFRLGLRTPPQLVNMPGASACNSLDQVKSFLSTTVKRVQRFESAGSPHVTAAEQKQKHHARMMDTQFYRQMVAVEFALKCETEEDGKDEL